MSDIYSNPSLLHQHRLELALSIWLDHHRHANVDPASGHPAQFGISAALPPPACFPWALAVSLGFRPATVKG